MHRLVALILLCSSAACLAAQSSEPARVLITPDFTWSLLAWGFKNGGKDTTTGMKVVDVDIDTQASMIPALRAAGHIVLCYFSAGTLEPWRPDCKANKTLWQEAAVGEMKGWDEEWLDIRKPLVQELMAPRFYKAVAEGCHGIEPDNIDCYQNKDCWSKMTNPSVSSGNDILPQQTAYDTWLTTLGHSLGLAVAMKNAVGLVAAIGDDFDCAVNEQCQTYDECKTLKPFVAADKAVFQVEYTANAAFCAGAAKYGMQTKYCDGSNSQGLCTSGAWTDCFAATSPLPPTRYTNGTVVY